LYHCKLHDHTEGIAIKKYFKNCTENTKTFFIFLETNMNEDLL